MVEFNKMVLSSNYYNYKNQINYSVKSLTVNFLTKFDYFTHY